MKRNKGNKYLPSQIQSEKFVGKNKNQQGNSDSDSEDGLWDPTKKPTQSLSDLAK